MNILFYITRYPAYGGIERVTTVLANYFAKTYNWNISILSVEQQNEEKLLGLLDSSVNSYRIPYPDRITDTRNKSYFDYLLKELSIDTIIFQDSYALVEPLLYPISQNIKIMVVEHSTPDCYLKMYNYGWKNIRAKTPIEYLKKIFYPYFYIKILREIRRRHCHLYHLADRYILLSRNFTSIFTKVSGIKLTGKLEVIGNPLTIPVPQDHNFPKEKVCLFVGRLTGTKGIHLLMDIWKEIEKSGSKWKLIIVGDGDKREFIEQYLAKNKLKQIRLAGSQADVIPFYREATILCMTSIFEGWGLVLVEAMAYGCIPMAFNSFLSVSEIIDHEKNGYLIPPFDKKAYCRKLLSLMDNSELCHDMSENAILKSSSFSIDKIGQQWKNILS